MTPDAFVLAQTVIAAPPLVPEIRLHLATEVTPLWEATEATLARHHLPPPYWAFAWAGGQALARLVLDRPELVAGRRTLDFGAGSGLVAIAAATAGARASAAEIDPFAIAAIRRNAALNGVTVDALADDLLAAAAPDRWEVILVGDMCYEKPLAERLLAFVHKAARGGALILIGDPGRAYFPHGASNLERLAGYDVPTPLDLEDKAVRHTVVWRLHGETQP